ncbi:hypothetical protein Ancab_013570 [Ancistrocladus abbreviatus]
MDISVTMLAVFYPGFSNSVCAAAQSTSTQGLCPSMENSGDITYQRRILNCQGWFLCNYCSKLLNVCEEADEALKTMVQSVTPSSLHNLQACVGHSNLTRSEEQNEFGSVCLIQMAAVLLNDTLPEASLKPAILHHSNRYRIIGMMEELTLSSGLLCLQSFEVARHQFDRIKIGCFTGFLNYAVFGAGETFRRLGLPIKILNAAIIWHSIVALNIFQTTTDFHSTTRLATT